MSDPITNAAVVGVTTVTIAATVPATTYWLGAAPAAVILALVGALVAAMWQDDFNQPRKTWGGILFGMLIGGWATPAVLDLLVTHEYLNKISAENMLRFLPISLGAAVPLVGAPLLEKLRKWLGAS
jgi:hypothetical protein